MRRYLAGLVLSLGWLLLCVTNMAQATGTPVSMVNSQAFPINGVLYLPSVATPVPAVVLLHGCAGMYASSNPNKGVATLYREWAARLNDAGYAALVVDSFTGRQVTQNQCGNGSEGPSEVTDRPYDAYAAYTYLASHAAIDATRLAVMGWSHGASTVLATLSDTAVDAGKQPFRAGYAFYPGCGLYGALGGVKASSWKPSVPLTIFHADQDPLFQTGHCQQRVYNALAQHAELHFAVYVDAQHSFDNARSLTGLWTPADIAAKAAADAAVLQDLQRVLK